MEEVRFACTAVETFDLFDLPGWVTRERAGRIASSGPVSVFVSHPNREMDGSCRWCGCRDDETIVIANGRLA